MMSNTINSQQSGDEMRCRGMDDHTIQNLGVADSLWLLACLIGGHDK